MATQDLTLESARDRTAALGLELMTGPKDSGEFCYSIAEDASLVVSGRSLDGIIEWLDVWMTGTGKRRKSNHPKLSSRQLSKYFRE